MQPLVVSKLDVLFKDNNRVTSAEVRTGRLGSQYRDGNSVMTHEQLLLWQIQTPWQGSGPYEMQSQPCKAWWEESQYCLSGPKSPAWQSTFNRNYNSELLSED